MPDCQCNCCVRARDILNQKIMALRNDFKLYQEHDHQNAMDSLASEIGVLVRVRDAMSDNPLASEEAISPVPLFEKATK